MKFPAAVLFALGVIGVVNGHEVYERYGKVVEHYEEVFEVHDGRLDSPSVKEEDRKFSFFCLNNNYAPSIVPFLTLILLLPKQ